MILLVTMSAKVLHAGDGYTYLTREVASQDVKRDRGQSLADYYSAAGTPPGRWMGSGLAALGIEGRVSEDQMKALFGSGLHPDAFGRIASKRTDIIGSQAWRKALATALDQAADERGISRQDLAPADVDAVTQEIAPRVFKLAEHRDANGPEELASWVEHVTELNRKQDRWRVELSRKLAPLARERGVAPSNLPKAVIGRVRDGLAHQLHLELEGEPARSPQDLAGWVERMDVREMTSAQAERTAQRWLKQEQLGRAFPTFDTTKRDTWLEQSKAALTKAAKDAGVEVEGLDPEHRDYVVSSTAARVFEEVEHRLPKSQAELSSWIQRMEEKPREPVAGYDLVFTPPKSYSVLWALGDEATRRAVEEAHHAAVRSSMELLENEIAFTRTGAAGIAQVETNGVVAASFDHYDSRSGDPNLHTHFAVSNKVQGRDGKWRSLDGRVLHAAFVSVSTHYGAVVKAEIAERLSGITHEARTTGRDKRPVYEIAGIPRELCAEFSQRDARITDEFAQLLAQYRETYGRDPSPAVQHKLAKQATLSTRPEKQGLESLADKVAGWLPRALPHLAAAGYAGISPEDVPGLVTALAVAAGAAREPAERPTAAKLAERVVDVVSSERSEWKSWHLRNEAARQIEGLDGLSPAQAAALITAVTDHAVGLSIPLDPPDVYSRVPDLERSNGESIYSVHGQRQFSSAKVFEAEDRVLRTAEQTHAPMVTTERYQRWVETGAAAGLSPDQARLVERFATGTRLLEVAAGAAGSGKSTAMQKLAELARENGITVRAAAPSAVAAEELGEKINANGETLAKLLLEAKDDLDRSSIGRGDLVLVDEASMASTRDLDRLVQICTHKGAHLRLLGDPYQLDAVEQGGLFRTLVDQTDGVELTTLHRFRDQTEARQTLRLRTGDVSGLDWYLRHGRVHGGTRERLLDTIYTDWRRDREDGVTSLMMVGDNETARTLSERARLDLVVAGKVERDGVDLHNGSVAGVGDTIVSRRNDRRIRVGRGYVKNGHTWTVTGRDEGGSLTVRNNANGAAGILPAHYVAEHVELGYASTIHRAQGVTVDRGRLLLDRLTGRNAFYVGMTRGRAENHAYVATEATVDLDLHHATPGPQSGRAALEEVVRRDDSARSAHDTLTENYEAGQSLAQIVPEYEDVRLRRAHRDNEIAATFDRAGFNAEQVSDLRRSTAWHTLEDRVLDLTDRGADAATALQVARQRGELTASPGQPAIDAAAVLAERLPNADTSRLAHLVERPGMFMVDQTPEGTLERALAERRARVADRVDHLATLARGQDWAARTLGEEPAEDRGREDWDSAIRYVAAYRDRYDIRDQDAALGAEPDVDGRQRDDWRHGQAIIAQVIARLEELERRRPEPEPDDSRNTVEESMARLRQLSNSGNTRTAEAPERATTREDPMERLRRLRDAQQPDQAAERSRATSDDAAARQAAEAERLRLEQERAEHQRQLEEEQRRAEQEREQGYGRDL